MGAEYKNQYKQAVAAVPGPCQLAGAAATKYSVKDMPNLSSLNATQRPHVNNTQDLHAAMKPFQLRNFQMNQTMTKDMME